MNAFLHQHMDLLASQLIERADLDSFAADKYPLLRDERLVEIRDRFDRALEFFFQLQPWEKMPTRTRR
jgi:hypothetical protein